MASYIPDLDEARDSSQYFPYISRFLTSWNALKYSVHKSNLPI